MAVTIHIPGPLRGYAGGAAQVVLEAAASTLAEALTELGARFPGVRDRVLDEQGCIRPHVNLFVDREDVRFGSGLQTGLRGDAVVHILPAVSGGAARTARGVFSGIHLEAVARAQLLRVRMRATVASMKRAFVLVAAIGAAVTTPRPSCAQSRDLDARVQAFLDGARGTWRDMNVPYEDGKVLYDLIVARGFKSGLEIGTSTGHSGIWIAWAFSRTGGRLVTIEIDERRHREALRNFEAAGVASYVDARLADAHRLVKELPGPFDFVFADADKDWYPQYFTDVGPKLSKGGCFTAHNVANAFGGIRKFLELVRARSEYRTTIDNTSRSGVSISCKEK